MDQGSADTNGKGPLVGAIVCKLEPHRSGMRRGYVAMLATRPDYRRRGIASALVRRAVLQMKREGCDEVPPEPLFFIPIIYCFRDAQSSAANNV